MHRRPEHGGIDIPVAVRQAVPHSTNLAQGHGWQCLPNVFGQVFEQRLQLDDQLPRGQSGDLTLHALGALTLLPEIGEVAALRGQRLQGLEQLRDSRRRTLHRKALAVSLALSAALPREPMDMTSTGLPKISSSSISSPA